MALGQAEKVTRLYELVREYALNAYGSLIELIGPALAKTAANQVVTWATDVINGKQFKILLENLYATAQTEQAIDQIVAASSVSLDKFAAAIGAVEAMDSAYQQQTDLIDKIVRGLRFVSIVPLAVLPQGKLFLAAIYIMLTAYVVLAGADYVDSSRFERLNRVPGVRRVVEENLKPA